MRDISLTFLRRRRGPHPGGGGPGVDAHPDPQSLVGAVGKQDPRGDQHQVDGKVRDLDSKYSMYTLLSLLSISKG